MLLSIVDLLEVGVVDQEREALAKGRATLEVIALLRRKQNLKGEVCLKPVDYLLLLRNSHEAGAVVATISESQPV